MLKRLAFALLIAASPFPVFAQALTSAQALSLAEKFVAENGYTKQQPEQLKNPFDYESLEWTGERAIMIKQRFNTLEDKAIGVKKTHPRKDTGWSVGFDLVDQAISEGRHCRVVTVGIDGSDIRVEHVDGIRKYFVGIDE